MPSDKIRKSEERLAAGAKQDALKKLVGEKGADMVRDGMVVGLGTGSTARYAIERLGERVKSGMDILGIPTSVESERLAHERGIEITTLEAHPDVDITIDGADEVGPDFTLIKGLGGALLREKIVAYATRIEVIVVDSSKLVEKLGVKTPVPVEVTRFEHVHTSRLLAKLGSEPKLRKTAQGEPFVTDNGNCIYDCKFDGFSAPRQLSECLDLIPGVVETGLFIDLADIVITASEKGVEVRKKPETI
jgi:ribose 5-phosphate isomerase A